MKIEIPEVASEMKGSFTPDELVDGTEVSVNRAQEKPDYWLAIGTVEPGTMTEYGHVAYRIVPEPT